jgi:phage baseplate assembly protein gpV
VIDELIKGIKESIGASAEGKREKFYGVVTGKVINPVDPYLLGRVQVQTPFVDCLDLSPWARVAQGMAGPLHGTYFIPNIGDEVLLAFEQGDTNAPYILGSLANLVSRPPLPSPIPQIRAIRTMTGNQIVFTEAPPSITIQTAPTPPFAEPLPPSPTGPHQTIMMSPTGVQIMSGLGVLIQVGASTVYLDPTTILLQAGGASIGIAAGVISLNATVISINGANVGIFGGQVRINS